MLGPIMDFKTLFVLACVAAGSLAGPVRETLCAEECNSRDDEGMFRAFKSYYFSYAVNIDSRINGSNGDQSSTVRVEATAVIEGLSACDMMLKLSNIGILERRQDGIMVETETASTFRETLEAHPLRFSMESNGTITSVCPEAGEEIWALNVKRGFLSHIQIKRTTSNDVLEEGGVFETSVTGTCMPVYSPTGAQTFIKRNDYLMCKHRTNLNMFVDAIPVHLLAPTASPLTSRMECEYSMESQGISSVECYETHTLKPFSESDSKPETVVHIHINKIKVMPTITSSLISEFARRTSLLYEDPIQVSEINSDDVRNTITQICESISDGISSETPGLFETLAKQFGELDTDNMNTVINRLFRICPQVETNEVINMVKDALTDCDTEQCAQGFHSIIQTENSPENDFYLRKWFMKLVFHKNPTKNMISLVHRHVHVSGSQKVNLPAYYAFSSMIHQYCRMSEDDCSRDSEIVNAAIIFEENLHESCIPEDEEDQKKMLMSLRAIGNMGLIQSKNLLNRCNRDQNPNQLRVAAIEAYRRASCDVVPIDRFMRIFSTIDNDSELRIAAYRAIIRCPSEELLQGIANTMAREPTNQVTCYVSSHLANLRNSQDPMVVDLQTAVSQSPLANVTKCGMDYRKFSHNYGLSYFDDESGNGIHFDSDVVFSSKSYLPRSARLAMNVDIFGYGLDLFELDARTEGWQEALEALMTPDEEDREANMIEKVKRMMKKRVSRQRREGIKNTALNKIKKEYESSHVVEQEVSEEAAVAMKVLGNDVFYKDQDDFQRMAEMFSKERIMEIITSLATQRTHEYSLNKNLKTSKVTIPTMAGMPLEVNIQGAFNTILKASGKLDVMGMMAKPRRMAIQGLFEPSAAIEIHSDMMVDAHGARSGLSHKTNLASSLSLGGSLSFENGMLKVKVNAPPRRETIISASSSLYFLQRNEMVPVSEPEDAVTAVEETLSDPRYSVHISGTRPDIPFSLPEALFHNWRMEVTLDKLEESLVSYDLEVGFRTDKAFRNGEIEKTDHIHFLIGAPGSVTLGAYVADLAYHRSNATLIINTDGPKGNTYFIGSLRNETNSKRLHIQQSVEGKTFVLEAGMDTIPLTNGFKFVPVFIVTVPDIVSYALQGHVSCTGEEKVWDLTLVDNSDRKLAALKGDFIKNSTLRRMSVSGILGSFSGSLQGGYRVEETPSSVMITPIFSLNTPFPPVSLSIGGEPLVISDNGVTMNELYLTTGDTRLIEVSNLHLQMRQRSFGFQGKIKETIPFGMNFDMTNDEQRQYSVDLTLTSIIGEYNIRGLLFNRSSDYIYRLEVITAVNNTEYFNVTTEFKNEVSAHQYLDTIIKFRGQQIYRTKNGLQTQELNAKTRYTPIFILETNQLGSLLVEGSVDVSESGILINNMALVGAESIFTLGGSASVDRDARSVTWSFSVGGAYVTEVISGSASHRENQVLFQTSMKSDESSTGPDYSLTIDLQNSTKENEIFAWDGKVELDMPHHPELSFRMDTDYNLTPGHSTGTVFRLCYDGIDCTSTNKRITLSHELTYNHDKENHMYIHDMEVTYTHPAVDKDVTMEWNTSCIPDISYGTQLTLKDHEDDLFTTAITYVPEGSSRKGSTDVLIRAPGYFDYEFTDTFHFSNPKDILWLSKYRSGEEVMSFQVRFNMTGEGSNFWTSTILEYTDIRSNAYTLEYIYADSALGNKLNSMTIKKNSDLKMLMFEEMTREVTEARILSRYIHVFKTTFQPVQDLSYNQTVNINLQNGNINMDQQLRFMPGQKPISLITDFTNKTTETKKEGQIITTLSLPKTSITVLTEGKLEKGVPSGNLSIKFKPLIGSAETYAVELAMKNRSSSPSRVYDTALILKSPLEKSYGIKHTVEWSEDTFFPMTSSLTGVFGEEEVIVGSSLTFDKTRNMRTEMDLSLTIPKHVYAFSGRFDMDSCNITITKDSHPIWVSNFSQDFQKSDAGFTYSLVIRENVMSYGSETTLTLSNISNAYAFNLQIQENNKEALYTDLTLDLFPGQMRFDLATEARSDFLPGYNTKTSLNFDKTEQSTTLSWSLNVNDQAVFSISFTNGSSDEPISRTTQLTFSLPTNPDIRLQQVVLSDSCSMTGQRITHNTTVMWGNLLPTQTIALRLICNKNDAGAGATLMLRNEGRVFGFGRFYTMAFGKTSTGSDRTGTITLAGETGNIFSLQTELTNNSMDYMKGYDTSITMTVLDRHPITVESSLIHNSSDTVLNANLAITYSMEENQKLTAGIEVTRMLNGHSVGVKLQHLVNTIDVTIFGAYSNSSQIFEMTLENSVLLGDERHQPEISFSLNRGTQEMSFGYTGSRNYGFSGRFLNLSNEDGRVYEINCNNTYFTRVVPYSMFFSEPRRLVRMMVQYNPDNVEDNWEFTAGYKNDTVIFASLDTVHSGQTIHNGSVFLSLDRIMPKVLTTEITWEPSWPQDLKAAVLNIINKTKTLRDQKRAAMCSSWKALAQRINRTITDFMLSNVNIYTQIQLLKTQMETQWTLTRPMRMMQLGHLIGTWMRFNQTVYDNLLSTGSDETLRGYKPFAAEFEDIKEYFDSNFDMFYNEQVLTDWTAFEEALKAIEDQFNGTAIASHWAASVEAKNAFFTNLWEQFEKDVVALDPNWDALKERVDTIGQNLKAIGPRISEEFNTRISALESEKRAMKSIIAAIVEDIQAFNTTLRGVIARWEESIERELEPFRNTDFSWFVNLVNELNETIRTLVDKEEALLLLEMTTATFQTPYVGILVRNRRQTQTLGRRAGNLDAEAIKAALAKFNSDYGIPTNPRQVTIPSVPVIPEVEEVQKSTFNFTAVLNVLKKVFNGTYEMTKLDLVNGEIIFKIFVKDFSNFTSLTNLTRQYLDMLPWNVLERINVTKIQKMIGMLREGSLSEFKARFMEQFTANRTYYEEMMREVQTRVENGLQDTMETRVVPYLERLGDRIVEGGRPFFGRVMDLPDSEERRSFLEELTNEMDLAGLERMTGRMKQTMCGVYNTISAAAMTVRLATCPHSLRSWLPPYKANALVIGAKHYMTFDKQFYDFSGKCGYLLAKDFVHENDFSAIVDYERDMEIPIRNMMFMINSTTFEIKSDGTVRVNRDIRELPLQVGDTAVIRIGDSIFLKNAHGVSVVCKLPHDICVLQLSGRYFDRTAGLLGNFNFEPYDDFKTPGNEVQTNITSFTDSWKVGKNCIQSESASLDLNRVIPSMDAVVNFDPLYPDNQACANLFLDNCSPLARCHGGVDPDSFYRMCILDTRNLPEEERQTKMCNIAAAYKTQCWNARQPVKMPDTCMTCEVGDESFQAGKPVRIEGDDVPRKVDIVFVVEEKRCAEQDARLLDNLVIKLAGELQDAGFNDTQFGLAAFGGSGVHDAAHQHTINHKIFNNRSRDFPLGRDFLEFADGGSNDAFAAIKLAANYPFRAGAAKHVILLSCSEFREEDTKLSFKELSVMLRKRAISLTILLDYQFRLNKQFKSASKSKSKSKSELVYGIDTNATYTSKMAGQEIFKGSATLRRYTNEPDGVLPLLAQESGGAIFDSSMLGDKGFNEVFVKRLVMKSEPAQCQVCSCVHDELVNIGRSVCEKCSNPLNVFGEEIRAGVRDFELKYRLRHWRYPDQIAEEEE